MQIPSNRRRGSAAVWGIVAVVLLCVAVGGFVYWKKHHRPSQASRLGGATATLDLGNGVALELVRVIPGEFTMGSPTDEPDRDISEDPPHKVKISKPFYIGKFEITQAQWETIRGNQSSFKGPTLPAEDVSWGDATGWCKEMSQRLGVNVRLPTEAEWEYACRAGTSTPFAFGAALKPGDATFASTKTSPVGSGKPNAWGLYDMHGNVWEWCQDTLQPDYTGAPTDGSAWIDDKGDNKFNRVRRGGSWKEAAANCRSAVRFGSAASEKEPDMRNDQVGFRVVVDVPAGN